MTDKRKRGRPKKIVELQEFHKEFQEKGYAITPNKGILAVDGDKFEPFPDNWFSMSKIDKLAWLTEQNTKK